MDVIPEFASKIKESPAFPYFMVLGYGYWGRGATVAEAIYNASYLEARDIVLVCRCDMGAHVDDMGRIIYNARSPIYAGTINRGVRDITLTAFGTGTDADQTIQ